MTTPSPAPKAKSVVLQAPAKLNLTLDVVGRRPDGFHEVVTVYQTLTLADRVEVSLAYGPGEPDISVRADAPDVPDGPNNLAHRAAAAVLESVRGRVGGHRPPAAPEGSPKVVVDIHKAIPTAAGLGGGSSDAAAVLRGLNGLLDRPLDEVALHGLAARLGSDVPFFLRGGTAVGRGRGEVVEPLPDAPRLQVVLIKAGRKESTAAVYAAHDRLTPTGAPERSSLAVEAIRRGDPTGLVAAVGNDLAAAARHLTPEIARAESFLAGLRAEAVAVTGAGPTVFGLFRDSSTAASACGRAAADYDWTALAEFAPAAGER